MPSGADNLTLPTTFYRGTVSGSPACASETPVRRSRRERLLRLYGAALLAGDAVIWLVAVLSLSLILPGLHPSNHLPTISLISLPLLCIAGVLYSISGYDRNADMQSLEFTRYLSHWHRRRVLPLHCSGLFSWNLWRRDSAAPHPPPAVLCALRAIVSPYSPCARGAGGKIDREKGRSACDRLQRGRRSNSTARSAAWAIPTQSASSTLVWKPTVRSSWMDQARPRSIPFGSAGSPSSDRATTQSSLRETRPNSRRHSHKNLSISTFTRYPS